MSKYHEDLIKAQQEQLEALNEKQLDETIEGYKKYKPERYCKFSRCSKRAGCENAHSPGRVCNLDVCPYVYCVLAHPRLTESVVCGAGEATSAT